MHQRAGIRAMAAIASLVVTACAEHVPDGPGPGDHTPPDITAVVAWDVSHVTVVFNEPVTRWSADNAAHYYIERVTVPFSAAGDGGPALESYVIAASLHSDNRTVTLTTPPMSEGRYLVVVDEVSDVHGNVIMKPAERGFDGTDISDTTPPEIVYRLPATDAPGISTRTIVAVAFTEEVQSDTVVRGLRVLGEGARKVYIRYDDLLHFFCGVDSLQPDTRYTVALTGVRDLAGNTMDGVEWTFDTQATRDSTGPKVISSTPANGAVNVDPNTPLTLTFSEPMDPESVILRPHVKSGFTQWSDGGRRLRREVTWSDGTQYTVQIRPGEMTDQAGNPGTQLFTLTFSTGVALETGSFAGTISGDPRSARAANPAGGLVFAGVTSPQDLYTSVVAMVGAGGAYQIGHLKDGTYYPFFVMNSDGNGIYQPRYGDALGVYGVTDWFPPGEAQTVVVGDDRVTGVDFAIYDPTAVYGLITHDGSPDAVIHVGLFDAGGFDPSTSVPVVATIAGFDGVWDYVINTLDTGPIPDGRYYVAAYVDTDANGIFDPSIDRWGIYGGVTPVAIDLSRGADAGNVNFELHAPPSATASLAGIPWAVAPRSPLLQRVVEMLAASDTP